MIFSTTNLSTAERINIASNIGEEVISRKELEGAFMSGYELIAYDGFELSGIPHIAQVLMKAYNVNQLIKAGCKFKFWIADWFTLLNNKLGGDSNNIRLVGEYMIEVWRAAGMDLNNVEFLWASEEINKRSEYYWQIVMDVSRKYSVTRMKRCIPALGRTGDIKKTYDDHIAKANEYKMEQKYKEAYEELEKANTILEHMDDNIPLSYLLYAAMQTADIFFLDADICQLGMDQRKVNMLAREYTDLINKDKNSVVKHRLKPIIISHHMLMGLQQGQEKMSKSDPNSGIFITDTSSQVKNKIKKAYCVPGDIITNPILDYTKYIIFPHLDGKVPLVIQTKHNGLLSYNTFEELEQAYKNEIIHPSDLKPVVAKELNNLLEPIRDHFDTNEYAKSLLDKVKKIKITR